MMLGELVHTHDGAEILRPPLAFVRRAAVAMALHTAVRSIPALF